MAKIGFPEHFCVSLGSAWAPDKNGLGPGDIIHLRRVNDVWTESGQSNHNPTINRLKFSPQTHSVSYNVHIFAEGASVGLWGNIGNAIGALGPSLDYTFLDIFAGTPFYQVWYDSFNFLDGTPNSHNYNNDIFSAMGVITDEGLFVNDTDPSVTIPRNSPTVTDFGTIESGSPNLDKIFNVCNLCDPLISGISVEVPNGYIVVEALSGWLDTDQCDNFTVELETDTVGIFTGDITIWSDHEYTPSDSGFAFPVSGEITGAGPASTEKYNIWIT